MCIRDRFKIVVGMLKIADSVLSLGDVDGSVRHHLDVLSVKYALILPGDVYKRQFVGNKEFQVADLEEALREPTDKRIFVISKAMRAGYTVDRCV